MKEDETMTTDPFNVAAGSPEFWVSHYSRCLSFHDEPGFTKTSFPELSVMWRSAFQLLERGYLIK